MKIAIAGFLHETNTFAPTKADFEAFTRGGGYIPLVEGPAMLEAARGVNLGISGMIDAARDAHWEICPLLWAGAIPSAHVTRAAYERIAADIVMRLREALPVDGVLLDLHGAMVAEHLDDGEGALVAMIREVVGKDVPVVAALDLHGNLSRGLIDRLDGAVGFRTYPHVDMAETGARAARMLDRMVRSGRRPAKAFRQMDFLVPIPFQCTDLAPADALYAHAASLDERDDIWSASLFMGFPAADIPDCGPSAICFADTQDAADRGADAIAQRYADAEGSFDATTFDADAAIAEAVRLTHEAAVGPIVVADTQDNPGAGGISATTGLLRAMIAADVENAAIGILVDPMAAALAHRSGIGATLDCRLGGHPDRQDYPSLELRAVVEHLSDGKLHATGGYYGGTHLDLGPSACLRIGGVRVVVTSRIAQTADREMFRFVGIVPEEQSIVVVKSSTHFRADFAPIAAAILVALSPGPMPFDPADLPFTRLRPALRLHPGGPAFGSGTARQEKIQQGETT